MIGLDSYSRQVFNYLDPIFYQSLNRQPIWNLQNCRFETGLSKTTIEQQVALPRWYTTLAGKHSGCDEKKTLYRVKYGMTDIPSSRFLHPVMSSTRGHSLWYIVSNYCRTNVYLHSVFPSGIWLSNQLSEPTAMSETLEGFQVFTKLYIQNCYI